MKLSYVNINEHSFPLYETDALVIGSGCAGYNSVDWLFDLGIENIVLVTEGINKGTSRNTGSDKQTYYKLSLSSSEQDSVRDMAESLFDGGSVNGDTALVEAACSVKCFIKLSNMGVPFPTNMYGEYVGYMTDHDKHKRATSAGPLTSKYMVEALEKSVKKKKIDILDKIQIFKLLTKDDKIIGAAGIRLSSDVTAGERLVFFKTPNIIMATGGPAGIYEKSVYPQSQTGMTGMAAEAGAVMVNLQEWQYGLASVDFRWNVSGTYQQVIPKYISVDENGKEREFLYDYFDDPKDAVNFVFMKGYQWPFDTAKLGGSSVIDLIVYNETVRKGNRVYMDFRENPSILENGFDPLSDEARQYLENSGALSGKPIDRLKKMNAKAIELYLSHGIDLTKEPLRIEVCAQHNNGGIAVDHNWQTNIKGLYAAGEAAGTFGIYRPGGTALNSTQVGSMRAAEHICYEGSFDGLDNDEFMKEAQKQAEKDVGFILNLQENDALDDRILSDTKRLRKEMSDFAAFIRNRDKIGDMIISSERELDGIYSKYKNISAHQAGAFYKLRDMIVTRMAVLTSMKSCCDAIGTRGGALCVDGNTDMDALAKLKAPDYVRDTDKAVYCRYEDKKFNVALRQVRAIPESDVWFENVWNDYLKRRRNSENEQRVYN